MDNKIKHLEFIQAIITRMNSNSFMIKGWAITLVSALFALSASNTNSAFIIIAYIPALVFWGLDGYYLSQERQYRALYKAVSLIKKDEDITFSLNASKFNEEKNTWGSCCLSKTIFWFYSPLILIMLIVMYSLILLK